RAVGVGGGGRGGGGGGGAAGSWAARPRLWEIGERPRMNRIWAWRRVDDVPGRGLGCLSQSPGERGLAGMERTREPIGYVVGQSRPRHDETPRADRGERRFDPGVSAGRNGERLEERVL